VAIAERGHSIVAGGTFGSGKGRVLTVSVEVMLARSAREAPVETSFRLVVGVLLIAHGLVHLMWFAPNEETA
jgi:uncharacterized membrane protein